MELGRAGRIRVQRGYNPAGVEGVIDGFAPKWLAHEGGGGDLYRTRRHGQMAQAARGIYQRVPRMPLRCRTAAYLPGLNPRRLGPYDFKPHPELWSPRNMQKMGLSTLFPPVLHPRSTRFQPTFRLRPRVWPQSARAQATPVRSLARRLTYHSVARIPKFDCKNARLADGAGAIDPVRR